MPDVTATPAAATTPAAPSSPAPASSPAAPSTESPGSSDSGGFDFAALAAHDAGDYGAPPSGPPASTPTKSETAKPEVPSPAAPTPGTSPAPVVPPAATSQPASPSPTAPVAGQPPAPAAVPASPTAPAAPEPVNFEQHRKEFLPQLEKLYNLTDEEAEVVRTAPDKALPKLAARLHYEVQASTYNALLHVIPDVLNMLMDRRATADKADAAFFSKWPKLAGDGHVETVRQSIRAYRAANPKAPMEKVIEQAGLMSMISLGIPLDLPGITTPAANPAEPPPPAPIPTRPPGIGGAAQITPPKPHEGSGNIFTDLTDDVLAGRL